MDLSSVSECLTAPSLTSSGRKPGWSKSEAGGTGEVFCHSMWQQTLCSVSSTWNPCLPTKGAKHQPPTHQYGTKKATKQKVLPPPRRAKVLVHSSELRVVTIEQHPHEERCEQAHTTQDHTGLRTGSTWATQHSHLGPPPSRGGYCSTILVGYPWWRVLVQDTGYVFQPLFTAERAIPNDLIFEPRRLTNAMVH